MVGAEAPAADYSAAGGVRPSRHHVGRSACVSAPLCHSNRTGRNDYFRACSSDGSGMSNSSSCSVWVGSWSRRATCSRSVSECVGRSLRRSGGVAYASFSVSVAPCAVMQADSAFPSWWSNASGTTTARVARFTTRWSRFETGSSGISRSPARPSTGHTGRLHHQRCRRCPDEVLPRKADQMTGCTSDSWRSVPAGPPPNRSSHPAGSSVRINRPDRSPVRQSRRRQRVQWTSRSPCRRR